MKTIQLAISVMCLILILGCGKEIHSPGTGKETGASDNIVLVDAKDSTILAYLIRQMDQFDKGQLSYALESTKPGKPFEWENTQTGNSYRVSFFSNKAGAKQECEKVEIYSAKKRLKTCVDVHQDSQQGWMLKTQL